MNLRTGRNTPPEEHEWPDIYDRLDKAHKSWIIVGPIHAFATNWRAWVTMVAIVGMLNAPEISAAVRSALQALAGVGP